MSFLEFLTLVLDLFTYLLVFDDGMNETLYQSETVMCKQWENILKNSIKAFYTKITIIASPLIPSSNLSYYKHLE